VLDDAGAVVPRIIVGTGTVAPFVCCIKSSIPYARFSIWSRKDSAKWACLRRISVTTSRASALPDVAAELARAWTVGWVALDVLTEIRREQAHLAESLRDQMENLA
jgi:hypothetical protein